MAFEGSVALLVIVLAVKVRRMLPEQRLCKPCRSPQGLNTGYDDDEVFAYALNRGCLSQHMLRPRAPGLSPGLASNQTQMSLSHQIFVNAKSRGKPVAERPHD